MRVNIVDLVKSFSNEYLLAKFGAGLPASQPAENEPSKFARSSGAAAPRRRCIQLLHLRSARSSGPSCRRWTLLFVRRRAWGWSGAGAGQTLEGSSSAVSTPIFASKYSVCSIFRDLQDYQSGFPIFAIFQFLCTVFCFNGFISFI